MTEKEKLEIEKSNLENGNPWTKKNFNLSEQGRVLKTDPAQAEKLQAAAGRIAAIDAARAELNRATPQQLPTPKGWPVDTRKRKPQPRRFL
jgi:hypothetical protein